MEIEKCQTRGQASHAVYGGQVCGSMCLMQRKAKRNKSGLSRNQSTIMPEDYVVSSSLNQMMKSENTPWKTLVESWKFRCQQQCLVKQQYIAAVKTCRNIGKHETKYACIVDADEKKYRKDIMKITSLQKGMNSLSHENLVHKFIPMLQALKLPDAKAAVENEWEKLEKIPAWQLTKVRNKKEVVEEARNKGTKVHFASLMDLCHVKSSEFESFNIRSTKAESYSEVTL